VIWGSRKKVSYIKGKSIEAMRSEEKRKTSKNKKRQNLRKMWNTFKWPIPMKWNVSIRRRGERERCRKKYLKMCPEIWWKTLINTPKFSEHQVVNPKRSTPWYLLVKLFKAKDIEKIPESSKRKTTPHIQGNLNNSRHIRMNGVQKAGGWLTVLKVKVINPKSHI